ncbi:MAG: ion transporter [Geminicoccaceae bacterium]|nr:MAG: ion transporter [Geminicoccaceae bacterium]
MGRVRAILELPAFEKIIMVVIVVNGITLGLETVPSVMQAVGPTLLLIDRICLSIFVAELLTKLVVYRAEFFRRPWNWFDAIVVGVALVPAQEGFAVLRAFRILRVLRLISVVPKMRMVVVALLHAIPGMGSVVALLTLVFYVFAVMATKLFGASFPDWFGNIGASFYSLFQIMTLESWSMGIVRPVMEVYGWAWAFFVPFILMTTFAVLNLFIAIIVNAMTEVHVEDEQQKSLDHHEVMKELRALRDEVRALREARGAAGDQPEIQRP